jgi:GNAT superfamily N-acetyltransferase
MRLAEPVRLAEGQVAASGAVLARAFADDPIFIHALSDLTERVRLLPPFMQACTRYGLLFGEVYVTAGPVEGTAIWLPPGATIRTEERNEQAGLTAAVTAFGAGARARVAAAVHHLDGIRGQVRSIPHWYLWFIGVDPSRHGLGLGSQLMRRGLARADQGGVECHLITFQSRNLPLYQRHGFEIAVEGDIPDRGPHFWFMRRGPHSITL